MSDFAKQVSDHVSAFADWTDRVIERAAEIWMAKVKRRTPVDTGYAQSRWQLTKTGKFQYQVTNDAVYILALEYGHSAQAPAGMVRISAADWQMCINQAAREIPL